jgi:CDP-glycerol glycerophosphotransferase
VRLGRVPALRRIPGALERGAEDVVLYESWHGRYSDNPRAIFEELLRTGAPLRHVWALEPDAGEVAGDATVVRPDSAAYLRWLARARYVVTNNTLPGYARLAPGAFYLQTWHGTPLKRIGLDIPRPSFTGADRYLELLARDVARWNLLVSPNAFSTQVFRRAFGYEGEVLESGYPRNDLLLAPERDAIRARVRRELGVEDGQRAILYAPTWRDGQDFRLELDLGAVTHELGDDHVTLVRAHHLIAPALDLRERPGVRDVSAIDDIREIYLAADVLVTDYSSVMFDFAVTGKPILFFTYDLDLYRDELRGFYFDFEAEAPGPLVASTAELLTALADLEAVSSAHATAYAGFRQRFCGLEDGRAAARVAAAAFGG